MIKAKNNFKRLSAEECAQRLLSIENPVIMLHVRPDGDAVGSGAALSEIFRQLGTEAPILSPDKIPDRLLFITRHCETPFINNSAERYAVAIDVASPAQLGKLYSEENSPVLMIDHHAVGTQFADGYIVPEASSAAEALFDVAKALMALGKITMTEKLAYALYAAISSDTGCFRYSNASSETHLRAAELIMLGIDSADINHRLFSSKTEEQIKAEGYIAASLKTAKGGKIAYSSITLEALDRLGLSSEDFETAIDIVRSLNGCEIAVLAKETEKGSFKISMRSVGADVASIAQKFGGGGHIRAAGCTVTAESADEAIKKILGNPVL